MMAKELIQRSDRNAQRFRFEISSSATPDRLFQLLSDAPSWPMWFPAARRVDWVRSGNDGQRGTVGAVRRVLLGPIAVEEEILVSRAPLHHAYRINTAIPVKDHRADVWFHPVEGGTRIVWTSSFTSGVPRMGQPIASGLRFGVSRLARALVKAAEG